MRRFVFRGGVSAGITALPPESRCRSPILSGWTTWHAHRRAGRDRGRFPTVDWCHDRRVLGVRARVIDRNKIPRWANSVIDSIADAPMSPLGRIAARRLGTPAPLGSIPTTSFDDRPVRVLIAPVNYSGQGRAWAQALERFDPTISARNMAIDVPGGFSFAADIVVPVGTYHNDADWQCRQFNSARRATHMLIEAEQPPFGRLYGRSVAAQARALQDAEVDVAYLGHGTDVRLPSRHIADNELSYYADPSIYIPRAEALARRNIDLMRASGRALFVSTPDLLADLPDAVWCPVVVDLDRWGARRTPRRPGAPLRVAHAPSVAANKGTNLVMPALERLIAAGVIELDLIRGVPSAEMPARFARADVVLDQFRTGAYGVAACEAMAAGCVVVGSIPARVRDTVATLTDRKLPVVEATPTTIESVLVDLASDPDLESLSEQGLAVVVAVHDGRLSAGVLIDHWIEPNGTSDRKGAPRASDH
jgi:hypothetical protein